MNTLERKGKLLKHVSKKNCFFSWEFFNNSLNDRFHGSAYRYFILRGVNFWIKYHFYILYCVFVIIKWLIAAIKNYANKHFKDIIKSSFNVQKKSWPSLLRMSIENEIFEDQLVINLKNEKSKCDLRHFFKILNWTFSS